MRKTTGVGSIRARRKNSPYFALLDQASKPEELDLPGYRLHPLKAGRSGYWSVTIRANWRIIFHFEGQDVTDVDYLDYH